MLKIIQDPIKETLSINKTLNCAYSFVNRSSVLKLGGNIFVEPNGNLKVEWTVTPPTLYVAFPVNERINPFLFKGSLSSCLS